MGAAKIFFIISTAIFAGLIGVTWMNLAKSMDVPVLEEVYWGPGNAPTKQDTSIKPMKVEFSEEMITDLKQRLSKTRYSPPLEGIAQQYGFNSNLLKEIVSFWQTKYNFKEKEAFLNKYPHYKTNIQGLDIHYMHIKPKVTKGVTVLPMLLLHGWPGSIREFYDIIPLLTTKNPKHDFVFELIVPSLPGFGFSQAPAKPGCGAHQMAVIFKNLMLRLGHKQFYLQGGDWGSIIAADMATLFREHILGIHCNMCLVSTPYSWLMRFTGAIYPSLIVEEQYQNRLYPLLPWLKNTILETGYYHIQATKPDTVGAGLNDSPAGLAAYILEKFTTGTNPAWKERVDGGFKEVFKYEDLLDNIMIYWVNNAATSAARIYAESTKNLHKVPIVVPSACSNFRNEIMYTPEGILKKRYVNLVQNTHHEVGGHFIAWQKPEMLAYDVFSSVDKMRKFKQGKSEL